MKVLVVGASSGLGAALMLWHAKNGDEVVGVGRTIDRVFVAIDEFSNVRTLKCDVRVQSNVRELVNLGNKADIIYYCAAQIDPAPPEDIIGINFVAFTELVAGLSNNGQRIVAISSLAAVISFENIPFYCASKSALEAWVNALPTDQRDRLLVVRPGKFDSDLFAKNERLEIDSLPHTVAKSICLISVSTSGIVNIGGFRDRLACFLAPIVGQNAVRKLLL